MNANGPARASSPGLPQTTFARRPCTRRDQSDEPVALHVRPGLINHNKKGMELSSRRRYVCRDCTQLEVDMHQTGQTSRLTPLSHRSRNPGCSAPPHRSGRALSGIRLLSQVRRPAVGSATGGECGLPANSAGSADRPPPRRCGPFGTAAAGRAETDASLRGPKRGETGNSPGRPSS